MKEFKVFNLILFTGGYGILCLLIFGFVTLDGLSVWMGINVGFAMIPLISIVYLYDRFLEMDYKIDWILVIGVVFFVFFYPNSFYILTDFIHIDSIDFYIYEMYEGITYLARIDPYLMMFHIIVSAIIGAFAGIQSLLYLEKIVAIKFNNNKITTAVVVVMLFLSSIGIYLGRFLRFFSWDVLRPFTLLSEFFQNFDIFVITFIVFFTMLELIVYYGYKYLVIKTPSKS